ncbi:hypothetical protein FACS1894141_3460 [Spirochaetia bacterium]|nr:hypothetical protein FACS1894141_3460 [Spirochaetia bacterium]
MTDEEYDALDELLTRTTPKLAGKPGGFFTERARQREAAEAAQTVPVDQVSIAWLRTMAEKTHKTPTEIIGEMVREKISVAAS